MREQSARADSAVRRGLRLASVALVGGGLVFAACGTASKVTTQHAVASSLSGLGSQSSISVTVSLGLSANQIRQLGGSGGQSPMTARQAQAISGASIFFAEQSGKGEPLDSKQASTDGANKYAFGLRLGSTVPIEFRYVGQAAYLHVQLSQLMSAVGAPTSSARSFQSALAPADKYVPGISALGKGQWVEIPKSSLQPLLGLAKQFGALQGGSAGTANSNLVMTDLAKLRNDIGNSFKNNATYQSAPTTGGRTKYTVTVMVQPLLQQIVTDLQADLASLPGGVGTKISSGLSSAKSQVPSTQTAVFQVYVQNKKTEEIDIDLSQFDHQVTSPLPVRIVIAPSPNIKAPPGARQLDLSKLPSLLSGLASGLSSSSSSSSSGQS